MKSNFQVYHPFKVLLAWVPVAGVATAGEGELELLYPGAASLLLGTLAPLHRKVRKMWIVVQCRRCV
jgi:hypothetical protein